MQYPQDPTAVANQMQEKTTLWHGAPTTALNSIIEHGIDPTINPLEGNYEELVHQPVAFDTDLFRSPEI